MKNKFTTIIIAFVVLGIIGVLILFGIIIINEFQNTQASSIIEDFKTSISDAKNTIDTDIRAPQIVENPLDNIQGTSTSNNVNYSNNNNFNLCIWWWLYYLVFTRLDN